MTEVALKTWLIRLHGRLERNSIVKASQPHKKGVYVRVWTYDEDRWELFDCNHE